MKVSEWLSQLDSHDIVDCEQSRQDFESKTGQSAPWGQGYSVTQMRRRIAKRGKGGNVNGNDHTRVIGALDIAEACADAFVPQPWYHGKVGMGFAFHACVKKIAECGH